MLIFKKNMCSSLEEYCLIAIVKNFDKIFKEFKARNENPNSFHKIAVNYSSQLLKRLKETNSLKGEHFDLLINPYVKELDLKGIDDRSIDSLVDSLQRYGKDIVSFRAEFMDMDKNLGRKLISSMPNLQRIEIGENKIPKVHDIVRCCPSEVFEEIGRSCPFIKVIKLNCEVDNNALMNIFKNSDGFYESRTLLERFYLRPDLLNLNLGISFVLDHAPMLKKLRYLDVGGVIYDKHRHDTSSKIYGLTYISFMEDTNLSLSEAIKVCAERCPLVSTVSLFDIENVLAIKRCSEFRHIEELGVFVSDEMEPPIHSGMDEFLQLAGHRLKRLTLFFCSLNVQTLIKCCPNLEFLEINDGHPLKLSKPDFSAPQLPKLPCLKTLAVAGVDFEDDIFGCFKLILEAAQGLKELIIKGCLNVEEVIITSLINSDCVEKVVLRSVPYFDDTLLINMISVEKLAQLQIEYC